MSAKQQSKTVDWNPATDAVCAAVLEAVADAKGVDPLDIDTPLYDVIDPDALDRLFGPTGRGRDVRLTFRYEDCEITVDGAGTVTAHAVTPTADEAIDTASALGAGFSP